MTDHLIYTDFNESAFLAAGGANFHVPRAGSPSRSLSFIAAAGDDLAGRHGTTTTTDWGLLSTEECHAAVDDEGIEGQFETAHIFDADDTASREIICDCCRGLGHMRRLCPSNRNRQRSLDYAINMLKSKLNTHGSEPARRPPARGQRPPFTAQPRRYAPAHPAAASLSHVSTLTTAPAATIIATRVARPPGSAAGATASAGSASPSP